jgi:hypothetical protein
LQVDFDAMDLWARSLVIVYLVIWQVNFEVIDPLF